MSTIQLPNHLLLGCATAATQIEGGDQNSNWYHWSLAGKIANNGSSITATNHYNLVEEDIQLLSSMNQEIYRLSIEWSRIEPEEGVWSEEGIAHYRKELTLLVEAGIQPLVTLHHFSHPQWFEDKGQWTGKNAVRYFMRFVRKVVRTLGDLISDYCTINEPNVFANDTYIDGKYPPGKFGDVPSYFKASKNMIKAHKECYYTIHNMRASKGYKDTKVGFAIHIAHFETSSKNPMSLATKRLLNHVFHDIYMDGMIGNDLDNVTSDFIGINYYSRHIVRPSANIGTLFTYVGVDPETPEERLNDLGWEIYPEGLYHVLKSTYKKYQLPIYITENGIPDSEDKKRTQFIYDHLIQVQKLIDEGVDVQRYYHWSFLDNLEWNDGYGPRFGLVEVNYDTYERTIRPSGHYYSEICRTKVLKGEHQLCN